MSIVTIILLIVALAVLALGFSNALLIRHIATLRAELQGELAKIKAAVQKKA